MGDVIRREELVCLTQDKRHGKAIRLLQEAICARLGICVLKVDSPAVEINAHQNDSVRERNAIEKPDSISVVMLNSVCKGTRFE
jgi:hypothetical protein